MYKVIIVDDEEIVREGIRNRIPWSELGFDLVGVAENGQDAFDIFQVTSADLILTDICMPVMDGLELTQSVKNLAPFVKIIILSGHDQFEYAQNAIKLGVSDYILKPITSKELKALLLKVKKELDDEQTEKNYLELLKEQVQKSLPVLKERFLNQLVSFPMKEDEINRNCSYLSLSLVSPAYTVLLSELDLMEKTFEDIQLLQFALSSLCGEILSKDEDVISFSNRNGQTVMIVTGTNEDFLQERVFFITKKIQQVVDEKLKMTVSIGVGNPVLHAKNIHVSYQEASSALEYRFLLGRNHIIYIADLEKRDRFFFQPLDLEKNLLKNIKIGTIEKTHQFIDAIFDQLEKTSLERCKLYIMELMVKLNNTFFELGIVPQQLWGESPIQFIEWHHHKTLIEIKDWLKRICEEANRLVYETRNVTAKQLVEQAKAYIQEHFAERDLSLKSICQFLHVSVSYFSLIFKNETGETFVEYLTKARMDKAKHLLKTTDLKTYEIAEITGYNDPHYFSSAFKKQVGVSPTEFRSVVQSIK